MSRENNYLIFSLTAINSKLVGQSQRMAGIGKAALPITKWFVLGVIEMDDYEKYLGACKKIRKFNKRLLRGFEDWLKASGLSAKTIQKHLYNIDFYINEFLLYQEATDAKDGAGSVDLFLGYWFIRKALWASQTSIRGNAASLKKFYTFMHEKGLIEDDDLANLKETIKRGMPEWLATLERFDDPFIDDVWEM